MAMGTFAFLMALTLGVIAFWAYNVYLLNQSGRLKRNNMHLILFQFNSLLTLICKDDPQMKLSHPPYSPLYILHGLCFMVWCLQIQHIHVASLLRLRLHGIQLHDELVRHLIMWSSFCCSVNVILKDQPNDKQGNLNRLRLRILVYASIIILLTSFVTLYVISISEECTDYLTKSR